jgi:hypothetical protein
MDPRIYEDAEEVGGAGSEDSGSDDDSETSESENNWIMWFTSLRGNELFCHVEPDYIQDAFNLTGLNSMVSMILSYHIVSY